MRTLPPILLGAVCLALAVGPARADGPEPDDLRAAAERAGSVNGLCPVTTVLVRPEAGSATYAGETIGFGDSDAVEAFRRDPTRYMDRMRLNPPKYWYVTNHPSVTDMRAARKAVGAANGRCPVMGKLVVPKGEASMYRGQRIQFCCPPCKAKFDKQPEKYMRRMRADPLAYAYDRPGPTNAQMRLARKAAGTVNGKCPVMGKLVVKKGGSATYRGETIGFCCPPCKAKFERDPASFMQRMRSEPAFYGYMPDAR